MHPICRLAAAVLFGTLSITSAAQAGELTLQIQDGLVMLRARDVSVREILAEWGRVGGTRIVNGERLQGGLVTLQMDGVPERQALDVLLRSASGYMAAQRADAGAGASVFDRILVLATSRVVPVPPAGPGAGPRPAGNIFAPVMPGGAPPDTSDIGVDDDQTQQMFGGAPGTPENARPNRFFPNAPQGPRFQPVDGQAGAAGAFVPVATDVESAPNQVTTSPEVPSATNPFGIPSGASARPGIVIQPPQPAPVVIPAPRQ
jgi:hypothetical protein